MGLPPASGLGYFSLGSFGGLVEGSDSVYGVRLQSYARQNTEERPYGVANDYVASMLGSAIGLPVPPGTLLELGGDALGYVSLAFSIKGDRLPPVIFPQFASERPWEATGVIAFDQWIANSDRHSENLAYHHRFGTAVFDHDLSLIIGAPDDPVRNLADNIDREIIRHELARHLKTAEYFESWCERIASVRTEEVRRIVANCKHAKLVTDELADEIVRFIDHRKMRIAEYLNRTKSEYSQIAEWPFTSDGAEDGH